MRIELGCVVFTAVALLFTGCAAHKPASANWRLVGQGSGQVLYPPQYVDRRGRPLNVALEAGAQARKCGDAVKVKGRRARIAIDPASLPTRAEGWLVTYAEELETRGCIAPGQAAQLQKAAVESIALDPALAWRVSYPAELLAPQHIQIVSPLVKDESKQVLEEGQTTGAGNTLNLTLKTTDNFVGYEKALYDVIPASSGSVIRLSRVEQTIDGKTQRADYPTVNYLQFPAEAAFFRTYVKSDQNEYTALVFAARSRADLDRMTDSCTSEPVGWCVALPKRVALNALVPVTVNGTEVLVRWGANVGEAMRTAGLRDFETMPAKLTVMRDYKGRATPVEFDATSRSIFQLPVNGGEVVTWHP